MCVRAGEDSLLQSRSDALRAALVRLLFLTRHFLLVHGRRWESCPPESKRPFTKKQVIPSHCTPTGEAFFCVCVCVSTVGSADTQGQTQFADGPTPSEKKKEEKRKTRRRCWMHVGPRALELCSKLKRIMGGAQEELEFTQKRPCPGGTLDCDGMLKVTQSWGSRDKVARFNNRTSRHLI